MGITATDRMGQLLVRTMCKTAFHRVVSDNTKAIMLQIICFVLLLADSFMAHHAI